MTGDRGTEQQRARNGRRVVSRTDIRMFGKTREPTDLDTTENPMTLDVAEVFERRNPVDHLRLSA